MNKTRTDTDYFYSNPFRSNSVAVMLKVPRFFKGFHKKKIKYNLRNILQVNYNSRVFVNNSSANPFENCAI